MINKITSEPKIIAESNKKNNIIILLLIFIITLLWMVVFQDIKHLIFPNITMWGSHLFTNIYSALFAVFVAMFVLNYRDKQKMKVKKEIDTEQALKREIDEAVSLLNAAIESTVDGILVVNQSGKITKTNQKFIDLWKIPASILETKDDTQLLEYVFAQLIEPGEFLEKVNHLYAHPNEESYDLIYFWDGRVYERYSKVQTINDKIIGRVWSFRDITEIKKSEEKLKLFEHTIASIHEIVNIADFNDNLIYVNRAFNEAYGYTTDEILGKNTSIFRSDKNPNEVVGGIKKATLNQGWTGELINQRKDGTFFPISLSTSVIRNHHNEPVALVGIAHDISDRKKKEKINEVLYRISQAVQVTESLDELYEKIHEILGELIPVNNFYIALYDPKTNLLSFPYFVDEDDEQPKPRNLKRGLTEYVLRTGETLLLYADQFNKLAETGEVELVGTPSQVWLGVPLKVSNKTMGVMVVQDYKNSDIYGENEKEVMTFVSEQIATAIYKKWTEDQLINYTNELKSVNELLSESEKMLKEMNASKDKFFSIISHDLKGPYQGLLSILDLLINNYDDLSDTEKKDIFIKVQENSKRTYNLLETLLQWARMQMGNVEFKKINFNLWTSVSEISDLLSESAYLKKLNIINSIDSKINFYADQNMVHLILRNLISNAMKFSNPESNIVISSVEYADHYEISVEDFGVGINKDVVDNLFRIDVQTSTVGTAKEKGSGLGLLLCKDMVTIHNGKIWVESVEGVGSKFKFTMPKH